MLELLKDWTSAKLPFGKPCSAPQVMKTVNFIKRDTFTIVQPYGYMPQLGAYGDVPYFAGFSEKFHYRAERMPNNLEPRYRVFEYAVEQLDWGLTILNYMPIEALFVKYKARIPIWHDMGPLRLQTAAMLLAGIEATITRADELGRRSEEFAEVQKDLFKSPSHWSRWLDPKHPVILKMASAYLKAEAPEVS